MGETNHHHAAAEQFIARWTGKTASELSTAQSFVIELCALLGVAPPTHELDYMFERTAIQAALSLSLTASLPQTPARA